VKCEDCQQQWLWETVDDFGRFFVPSNPKAVANADEEAMAWVIQQTVDILFDLLTATNAGEIAEAVYGPDMSAGVKDIFADQVKDVLAALRAQAVSRVREKRANILASVLKRSDQIM